MSVFVPYTELVEITGLTHDAINRVSGDLSAFLKNPSASGMLVRVVNGNAGAASGGVWGINGGADTWYQALPGTSGAVINAVRFEKDLGAVYTTGLNRMRYKLENASVKAYIVGEFHAGIAWHPVAVTVNPTAWAEHNTWLDRTVTVLGTDSVADVEAVILSFTAGNIAAAGSIGLRAKGSTNADIFGLTKNEGGMGWEAVKVDSNGQYQVYGSMKEDPLTVGTFIKELGYIRKGAGYTAIEDPQKETLATLGAYDMHSISAIAPASARTAVLKWGWLSGTTAGVYAVAREKDASYGVYIIVAEERAGCQVVPLNLDLEFEYFDTLADMGMYIVGYESYEPADTSAATLTVDSGTSLVIESNSPGGIG